MTLSSYTTIPRRLGTFIGAAAILLGGSAVVVWPLWYLATQRREIFNFGLAALIAILVLYALFRAVARGKVRRGSLRRASASGR
ncbi:MAG TPA: hypothetical protein VMV90_00780 [Rectinemataceae bacterium]|nr:hypothetical protein [Rectinemataceae bacterium]